MRRRFYVLVGLLFLCAILSSGCRQTKETALPTETISAVEAISPTETTLPIETQAWQIYQNDAYKFSMRYPSDWIIESESYQSLTLRPQEQISWQPSTPADIAKNPAVRIDFGEYIRERMGPASFPETISFDLLKTWLEKRIKGQGAKDFSEGSLNNFQMLEVTEISIPGCEKVVYWRPVDLKSLVKISTGCESLYLDDFKQIVHSIQQIE